MRLLLDECIPRRFKNSFPDHICRTVPEEGWAGKRNGELLALAEQSGFTVFLTLDRGIEFQQNLQPRRIAIVLVRAKSSCLADVLLHLPAIKEALESMQLGQLVKVG